MYRVLLLLIVFFSAMGYWAYENQISIDIQASGVAKTISKTKNIQYLETGVIKIIHVKEGDLVLAGDPIITIDPYINEKEVLAFEAEYKEKKNQLATVQNQMAINKPLLEDKLITIDEQLELQKEESVLLGDIGRLKQIIAKLKYKSKGTVVPAPSNGTVKEMHIGNPGAVVNPGDLIATITPTDDALVICAYLNLTDVGYVRVGQEAILRLPTNNRFKPIKGTVISISPDAVESYYEVKIAISIFEFTNGTLTYKITPGVPLAVNIVIGERSILDYLISPFGVYFRTALREL